MPDTDKFSARDIVVLSDLEAVRKRPRMYVGDLDDPLLPNRLLQEALCLARDQAASGLCKNVWVTLWPGGLASVRDDGPGVPGTYEDGVWKPNERLFSVIHACSAEKVHHEVGETACDFGMAVLNALCTHFTVTSADPHGNLWEASYHQGRRYSTLLQHYTGTYSLNDFAEAPFEPIKAELGTHLLFQLDRSILPNVEFQLDAFKAWAKEVRGLKVMAKMAEECPQRP